MEIPGYGQLIDSIANFVESGYSVPESVEKALQEWEEEWYKSLSKTDKVNFSKQLSEHLMQSLND